MASRSSLRASDADREQVADRLRKAAVEGRILASELEDRLATVLRAQTYGELDSVTRDLPGGRLAHNPSPQRALRQKPVTTVALLVGGTVMAFVLAALVIAGLLALSGVWVLLAIFWIVRGGGSRGRHRRHHRPYAPYRQMPSRW
jgi:Flp pilus assembly protein TadB